MDGNASLLVIVDAANVVGSVPDGWWRDRPAAARRLRDRLAADGVPGRA
ncbi:NTP pyrophosphohydrolase, partial [Streptomyces sp. PRKS01-65]|nr:NTP pyrophosphohydrolase [Streptomyces harenosi]